MSKTTKTTGGKYEQATDALTIAARMAIGLLPEGHPARVELEQAILFVREDLRIDLDRYVRS